MSGASGVQRLAHVSGIGADARSSSAYIRSRGEGESCVCAAFSAATIIRPAVMFGPDDAFLTSLMKMLRTFPVFPMFGRGRTALQPSYVEDVAEAIVRAFDAPQAGMVYELGGPRIYSYEELLRTVCAHLGVRRILIPVPFIMARARFRCRDDARAACHQKPSRTHGCRQRRLVYSSGFPSPRHRSARDRGSARLCAAKRLSLARGYHRWQSSRATSIGVETAVTTVA
jgi:nucleoside-diphosphate-sugar epimerase